MEIRYHNENGCVVHKEKIMEIGDSYPTLDSLIEKNGNPILIVDAEDYPEDKRMLHDVCIKYAVFDCPSANGATIVYGLTERYGWQINPSLRFPVGKLAKKVSSPLTEKEVDDACLSFRHDFGLMSEKEQDAMRFQAKEWFRSIMRARGVDV